MTETYDQRISRERAARTAREVAEQDAVTNLPILAAQVAAELGDGWSVDTSHETNSRAVAIVGPDSARIVLLVDWRKPERTNVTSDLPSGSYKVMASDDYKAGNVDISVATDRGAAVIAREITRRVLPVYTPILAKAQAAINRDNDAEANRAALVKRIGEEYGLSFGTDRDRGRSTASDWRTHPNLTVSLELTGDGNRGELTLRGDTTALLAALFAARKGARSVAP